MAKNYNPSVGDIIIKSFINEFDKKAARHAFVIVSIEEDLINALDERVIFGGFAVSGYRTIQWKNVTEELKDFGIHVVTEDINFKKESIVQVNSLTLFIDDINMIDKLGQVNPDIVRRALSFLEKLKEVGKLNIINNNISIVMPNIKNP